MIDYGLPTLTVEEFAREVGATPPEIVVWLSGLLYTKTIGASSHSKWTLAREPINEALVRLYLRQKAGLEIFLPAKAAPPPGRQSADQARLQGHGAKRTKPSIPRPRAREKTG